MKAVVQDSGLQPTKANLFTAYTKRVRSNIHIVVCMRYVNYYFNLKSYYWYMYQVLQHRISVYVQFS